MESLQPQLESLTENINDLQSVLQPLLTRPLTKTTSTLPLLDKAKLLILTIYALESILFSSLRLSGTDAKAHPVFQELARVKGYFAKVKAAEEIGAGGKTGGAGRLNKEAAGRFIRAGLAGNEKYDRDREERVTRERAGAKRKLEELGGVGTHTRFEATAKKIKKGEGEQVPVVKASEIESNEDEDSGEDEEESGDKDADGLDEHVSSLESLDQVAARTTKTARKKKDKQPLSGPKWAKAANAMQSEDPESIIPGVAKYDAKDEKRLGGNKKSSKGKKRKGVKQT